MPDNASDLWPELGGTFRSPVAILKEQAALLAQKSKGLLRAEIVSRPLKESDMLLHIFIIVAPAINYRYSLFFVRNPVLGYPAKLFVEHRPEGQPPPLEKPKRWPLVAKNEAQFLSILKNVLNSEKSKAVLNALLSQSS